MASIRSTIELIITGSTRGLNAASAEARRMAERVAAAEDRVSDARRRSAEAESQVADVEARLAGSRAQHEAALSRIGVAETNLARVRANSGDATTRLSQAEDRLEALRNGGASAETIARAEADITRVRQEADTAAANLQRAEAQLESARGNAARRAGEIAALEERLARARGNAFSSSEELARAENALNAVRRRGTDDMNRQRDGILGIFDAFGRLADAFSGADGASTSLLSKLSALNSVISSIGGPIVQAVVGLVEMAAVMGAIGEIVGVVGGLIGQAIGGAIPLILALGVAAGTVALGMDGIKKAAEVMEPAFNKLKAAVSDTFTRLLTPTFRELATVFPKITGGLTEMAGAISNVITRLVDIAASKAGIQDLQFTITGATDMIVAMTDGLGVFVKGLLDVGRAAAPAMQALGEAIGSIFGRLGEVFQRLSADGTIGRVVAGFAATITGLGAVVAPLIELFIRMGAALGNSLGVALTGVGAGIQQVIPFFEHLAQVAGGILVDAFNQLGPSISALVDSILPGASSGMDGFARLLHDVVFPAVRGFIDFLRTDGIPGITAFFKGLVIQATTFASSFLAAFDVVLAGLQTFFSVMALIPGPLQESFAKAAAVTEAFRGTVAGLKTTMDTVRDKTIAFTVNVPSDRTTGEQGILGVAASYARVNDKTVTVTANVPSGPLVGEQGILGVAASYARVNDKTVTVTANVPSGPTTGTLGNQVLEGAIGAVLSSTVTTTSNVPGGPLLGTLGNQALTGAIGAVINKSVTTTGNVPGGPTLGTQGNNELTGAIGRVVPKTVEVRANVTGTSAVQDLVSWIGRVVSKTVNVVTNIITHILSAAGNYLSRDILPMAGGGHLTPMSGKSARVVGANTWRVIGDRMSGDEAFIPINKSVRSQKILTLTAARMGWNLVPAGMAAGGVLAPGTGSGGSSVSPVEVRVFIGDEELRGIVRTEISSRDRATKRTVLAGSGVTF